MSTAKGPGRFSSRPDPMPVPEIDAPHDDGDGPLSSVLTVVTAVVLGAAGLVTGLLSVVTVGWLTRYWEAGILPQVLGVAGLLVLLAAVYTLCRLCAWGARRFSSAVAFALGFVAALLLVASYMPGGDRLLTAHLLHSAFLLGSMAVLGVAVARGLDGRNPFLAGLPRVPDTR
ncbi:hypothetical protein PWG71_07220 [Nocardiopsis sp. N85]|uniref:hypothetical protein n=1 Tax=Nocardiopsis sp. N85 TaxID=3029400 RepID=UPI00237F4EAD|nr:hypothetical protein [Nocardiopsis sp. N85]MDE3721175.1 hypothetical protein [Nocardiopsis sp. N85]